MNNRIFFIEYLSKKGKWKLTRKGPAGNSFVFATKDYNEAKDRLKVLESEYPEVQYQIHEYPSGYFFKRIKKLKMR